MMEQRSIIPQLEGSIIPLAISFSKSNYRQNKGKVCLTVNPTPDYQWYEDFIHHKNDCSDSLVSSQMKKLLTCEKIFVRLKKDFSLY